MIYLDNAATTLKKPQQVLDAVMQAMQTLGNGARGTHEESLAAARTVYGAREKLAVLFGAERADHVVFTANATEALNIAIHCAIPTGSHVISTDREHNSVLRPLYRREAASEITLDFVPADRNGQIDYGDFSRLIREDTRAIVCTHASNLTGDVTDLARVGAIAGEHGVLLIVDASQTAGAFPIDMQTLGIDILCFTGHKALLGPQGTGGLCIRGDLPLQPWKTGGTGVQTYSRTQPSQLPTLLEAGTLNGHGIAGLSAAVDYLNSVGLSAIRVYEDALTQRFYEGVSAIPGVRVYGDFTAAQHAPIVTLNIRDCDSGEVADALSERFGIATRSGAHCAPRLHEALGTREQGAVRFSFSCFTTEAEIDAAIEAVRTIAWEEQ